MQNNWINKFFQQKKILWFWKFFSFSFVDFKKKSLSNSFWNFTEIWFCRIGWDFKFFFFGKKKFGKKSYLKISCKKDL
jgi:hypothetical protein